MEALYPDLVPPQDLLAAIKVKGCTEDLEFRFHSRVSLPVSLTYRYIFFFTLIFRIGVQYSLPVLLPLFKLFNLWIRNPSVTKSDVLICCHHINSETRWVGFEPTSTVYETVLEPNSSLPRDNKAHIYNLLSYTLVD